MSDERRQLAERLLVALVSGGIETCEHPDNVQDNVALMLQYAEAFLAAAPAEQGALQPLDINVPAPVCEPATPAAAQPEAPKAETALRPVAWRMFNPSFCEGEGNEEQAWDYRTKRENFPPMPPGHQAEALCLLSEAEARERELLRLADIAEESRRDQVEQADRLRAERDKYLQLAGKNWSLIQRLEMQVLTILERAAEVCDAEAAQQQMLNERYRAEGEIEAAKSAARRIETAQELAAAIRRLRENGSNE